VRSSGGAAIPAHHFQHKRFEQEEAERAEEDKEKPARCALQTVIREFLDMTLEWSFIVWPSQKLDHEYP
jgi:hypothetical protein